MERVSIFIDGSNFYFQLKENGNPKVDYTHLPNALTGKSRQLIRTYYYVCPPSDPNHESYHTQQKFFTYLKNTPYFELKFGMLEQRGNETIEKGVDVQLAVDMVALAYTNAYDTAILISNDADLCPAVEQVKRLGKHVEYAYLANKTVQLLEASDLTRQLKKNLLTKA